MARYIGIMSGTSIDAIDAVLLQGDDAAWQIEATYTHAWPAETAAKLHALCLPSDNEIDRLGVAANEIATEFSKAVAGVLAAANLEPSAIRAIGSHGQTIRHRPERGFTLQIGNGALLAELTGIDVICDFRSKDMALGGQGAPLVPAFHQALFGKNGEQRVVLNIGGIANISVLPGSVAEVYGFDTGPGNTLLDNWYRRHQAGKFDFSGAWAATGTVIPELLQQLLAHSYFAQPAPKSTGREVFTLDWLDSVLAAFPALAPQDVQRTLLELTAQSICDQLPAPQGNPKLYLCGGGAYNPLLGERLSALAPAWQITTTKELGIDPDWVEGAAFAWLAHAFCERQPGNLPAVTGARRLAVLGCLYPAG